MILPMVILLDDVHIIDAIVQLNNFGFLPGVFFFLLGLELSLTDCWEPRFGDTCVRSIGALGVLWVGDPKPNPGIGGM